MPDTAWYEWGDDIPDDEQPFDRARVTTAVNLQRSTRLLVRDFRIAAPVHGVNTAAYLLQSCCWRSLAGELEITSVDAEKLLAHAETRSLGRAIRDRTLFDLRHRITQRAPLVDRKFMATIDDLWRGARERT